MKNNAGLILLVILLGCILCFAGCGSTIIGQGETAAEGQRRHLRQLELSRQQLADDFDALLLMDQPTRLSDKRIR